jgi:hypothetical protein
LNALRRATAHARPKSRTLKPISGAARTPVVKRD